MIFSVSIYTVFSMSTPNQGRHRYEVFYFGSRASDCILKVTLKLQDWNDKEAMA